MVTRIFVYCLLSAFGANSIFAQTGCGDVQLRLAPDYSFAIGSSSGGSGYSLTLGNKTLTQGPLTQLALFHYDTSLTSTIGTAPLMAAGVAYDTGKFGKGFYLQSGGQLTYPAANTLNLSEGTIEMWVATRYNGNDPVFANAGYPVFFYVAPNGDYFSIGEAAPGPVMTASASVNGQQEAAYNGTAGDMSGWKAGEWHHIAATFSASANHIRFYLDGVKIADTNQGHYFPPSASGGSFQIGSTAFTLDELRISKVALSDSDVAYDAAHAAPFLDDEVVLPLAGVSPGQLNYTVAGCGAAVYSFTGIPVSNLTPPGGLLKAGSTSFPIAFETIQPTDCRYSVGSAQDFASMQTLETGPPTMAHKGTVNGVSPDPRVFNRVYFRCASNPDYLHTATYRSVAPPGQAFPRIGNIWIRPDFYRTTPDLAKKTQILLGTSDFSAADAVQLRTANPGVLFFPAVNVEDSGGEGSPPDEYLLKDVLGNKIVTWCTPPRYNFNMTRPDVQQFIARFGYQDLLESNFVFDGVFFDSFNTSKSQPLIDCEGKVVQIDADGDGIADDPAALNAAWKAGVYATVSAFHALAPNAYISGHALSLPVESEALARFNGTSLEFFPQSVREGLLSFGALWDLYHSWDSAAVTPAITMIQACPPNQLTYGYGAFAALSMLPSTLAFTQSSYPNMRFGLGLALMGDGFFFFDFGDYPSPVTWWYDEYDFKLGYPIGPASQIEAEKPVNLLANGRFEAGLDGWQFTLFDDGNGKADIDTSVAAEGSSSAHIHIASAATANWHVSLGHGNIALSEGAEYRVQFWARADLPREITVFSPGVGPANPLSAVIKIGTSWSQYSASFTAPATVPNGQVVFRVGDVAGDVWLDDVQLYSPPAAFYRRDFTNGAVLLNGSASPRTVTLEPGFKRFTGTQAPLYQYMVDDADSAFSVAGSWSTVTYNTGSWGPVGRNLPFLPQFQNGPYYHCWEGTCHQLDSGTGQARWNLNIPADGQYTIQAWLPAAPDAATWTKNAVYEVVAGDNVLASAAIDQSTASAGDALHQVATLSLRAEDAPFLRVRNAGSGPLIADAVYITSAARYNDGSPAQQVTLGAFDSILLRREQPLPESTARVNAAVNGTSNQPAIAAGGFVSIYGTGFGDTSRSWTSSDFSGDNLPLSLDGVSVTINGKPAYVQYIGPTQINAIAPDDDTIGPVPVQVTTPLGASYTGTVLKQKASPGLFTYQSGTTIYAAAIHVDGTLVGPIGPSSRPAVPGEVIEIYATGFGATTPALPTAQLVSQAAQTTLPVTMTIGAWPLM
jgi:uncharacterized protein (TIGR03437 family)